MYPNLFGINDGSYIICMCIGILAAVFLAVIFLKKNGEKKSALIDLGICACFAVIFGIIFAILFENIYEAISLKEQYKWVWKMTFYGGLFGGVGGFLGTYFILRKKSTLRLGNILVIAPASIVLAHAIGRIGCFLAGCCYGKPTDSWIGIEFPGVGKVIPTQLIESIFLFVLFGILLFLILKYKFKYGFLIYIPAYAVFRFVIEFFRGDERGVAFALSPSQVWCIVLFAASIPLYFLLKKYFEKANEEK